MCLISVLIRLYTYVYVGAHIHTTIVPSWRVIAGPCSTTSADVDAPHCSLFGARYRRWGPSRLKFLCDSMSRAPWLLKTCQGLPKTLRTVLYLDVLHLDQQDFWEKLEQSPQTQMTSHDRWVAFFFIVTVPFANEAYLPVTAQQKPRTCMVGLPEHEFPEQEIAEGRAAEQIKAKRCTNRANHQVSKMYPNVSLFFAGA